MEITNKELYDEIQALKSLFEELNINQRDVLTLEQTAKYINISPSYCYKPTSTNQIPFYKPNGKMLYFNKSELDEWLLQHKSLSKDEIEQKANDYISKNESVIWIA